MKVNKKYMVRAVGDETILLNLDCAESVTKLNSTAAFILQGAEKGLTEEDIAAGLAAEYAIPAEKALADTKKTVSELLSLGILEK